MGETAETRAGLRRGLGAARGIAGLTFAGLMLIWSGLGPASKESEEGRVMGQSSTAAVAPAARPPIDLAAPAAVETATFALG